MSDAPSRPLRGGAALALVSGALLPFGLAPFELAPLGIASFALLLAALYGVSVKQALLLGWLAGCARYGVGTSWIWVSIHEHGNASVVLATIMVALFVAFLAIFPALAAAAFARVAARGPVAAVAALAGVQVLLEWLLTWLLTGFPWLFAGYTQQGWPLAGYAPVFGVLGVTWLTVGSGGALWALVVTRARGTPVRALAAAVVAAWLGGVVLAGVTWTAPRGEALDVALVQGVVDQKTKWSRAHREAITTRYVELSAPAWGADLVLWPEAALTVFAREAPSLLARLDTRARDAGSALVLGVPDYDRVPGDPRAVIFRNTAIALGTGDGRYVKQRLVPFGEYVPLEGLLRGLIEFFDLPMSRSGAGERDQRPLTIAGTEVVMAICYEIAYPNLVRGLADDPGMLLTISNDTWFGSSLGPDQHLQIASFRALELQRPLLRATNDGVTAVVDARGRIVDRLPRFEQGVLRAEVTPRTGRTPYARFGDVLVLLLVAATMVAAQLERRRSAGE